MPYAEDRVARLYYDKSCGSCTFFARAAVIATHHHVVAIPLNAPGADRDLGVLPEEVRFGAAHLVTDAHRRAGPDVVGPLLALALGERAFRAVDRIPMIDRSLRWIYLRLWNYRRTRGCGTARLA